MDNQSILALLADALEIDKESIGPETELQAIETFDSVGFLAIMASVDTHLHIVANPDQLAACVTVQDLIDMLAAM